MNGRISLEDSPMAIDPEWVQCEICNTYYNPRDIGLLFDRQICYDCTAEAYELFSENSLDNLFEGSIIPLHQECNDGRS